MWYGTVDYMRTFFGRAPAPELRSTEFWACDDISFELNPGEMLGLIGPNGSGKSTLLRVLNGILPPDRGSVEFRGRMGGLIALGAGFHPHMSGRENIFLNGALLGMSHKELKQKCDSIIEFAELGDFIEAPLNSYSSGMRVKLGFAIAIHCDLDIILIDEVLAVGDTRFQMKCLRKLEEFRLRGGAIILVMHRAQLLREICDRVLVLEHGKLIFDGDPIQGSDIYVAISRKRTHLEDERYLARILLGQAVPGLRMRAAGIEGVSKDEPNVTPFGQPIHLFFEFEPVAFIEKPCFSVGLKDIRNDEFRLVSESWQRQEPLAPGIVHRIEVTLDKINLLPGIYRVEFGVFDSSAESSVNRKNWLSLFLRDLFSLRISGDGDDLNSMVNLENKLEIGSIQ